MKCSDLVGSKRPSIFWPTRLCSNDFQVFVHFILFSGPFIFKNHRVKIRSTFQLNLFGPSFDLAQFLGQGSTDVFQLLIWTVKPCDRIIGVQIRTNQLIIWPPSMSDLNSQLFSQFQDHENFIRLEYLFRWWFQWTKETTRNWQVVLLKMELWKLSKSGLPEQFVFTWTVLIEPRHSLWIFEVWKSFVEPWWKPKRNIQAVKKSELLPRL